MAQDEQSIRLIEEHIRRLLEIMGFSTIEVRCRLSQALAAPATAKTLTQSRALVSDPSNRLYQASSVPESEELMIMLGAGVDGHLLIGPRGTHLAALQHIIRNILRRHLAPGTRISLDINGYQERQTKHLHALAETAAQQAVAGGRAVVMEPMSARDRRAVHAVLATRFDVETQSIGDEPDRRVVIKPV